MKKSLTLFLAMTFALLMLSGCNEKKSEPASPETPENPDTPASDVPVQSITLSETSYAFSELGKTLQIEATVLPSNATNPKVTWKSSNAAVATVSDKGLVTSVENGTATITATADGKSAKCEVSVDDGTIKDICDNRYMRVQIGDQVWLAENMRCNKYDTESGRKGAEITQYTKKNPGSATFNPYCVDASEMGLWDDNRYAMNITSKQVEKLGYLYNWAAAVGLEDENAAKRDTPFEGNRQGICPNGWHIPTEAEWNTLNEFLDPSVASKKLKTSSGWYENGHGTDEYSFAALPAGYAHGITVSNVGRLANFWTANPNVSTLAYSRDMSYSFNYMGSASSDKDMAFSVRCIKN